ncbi:cell wall hydrolase [Methylobacterium organophilum]|uniref:Cell wall hydrolase SleB domain-containing protein n=1 Tax=Methylobacterium organophilum TaxID=410 RepID=A0ABQ4T672_METOR|nr:cell wall hydrolase [Methylobacterium organophilum]GJE26818.1 hypothetical protein LKMONMHP_1672 [Methylobacterium organophilum]
MRFDRRIQTGIVLATLTAGPGLGGCGVLRPQEMTTGSIAPNAKVVAAPTRADKECLARAMYFESNRSDEEGLLAVGTVVMNRLDSPKYPGSVCEVVGQKRQFATGVLNRAVRDQDRPRIEKVADALLSGQRHSGVGQALHFHTAGRSYPYDNMHYVAQAGGNAFYEKSDREGYLPAPIPHAVVRTATGSLVPLQVAALSDAALVPSTPKAPGLAPVAAPVAVAQAPALPARVPTRYASAPGSAHARHATVDPARNICRVADEQWG